MKTPSIFSAFQKIRSLLTRKEKFNLLAIAAFAVCSSIFELITASVIVLFAQVLNQPEVGLKYLKKLGIENNTAHGNVIIYFAITVGVVYLVKNTIAAFEAFYQNYSIQKMNYNLKNILLGHYSNFEYGTYLTRNSVQGFQVINDDVERMFSTGMTALGSIVSECIIFICLIGLIIYINPSLAIVVFIIGGLIFILLTKSVLPRFYKFGEKGQEAGLYSSRNLMQFFHGFKEIILLGKRKYFIDKFSLYSLKKSNVTAMQASFNQLPRIVIEVLFVGVFIIVISILCLKYESSTQIIGILGGYLYAGFRLMPGLNRIINQLNNFKFSIPAIDRVYSEFNLIKNTVSNLDIENFKFDKQISINNINFKYINTNRNSIENLSLRIQKGECIGIAGVTGSGKSTLVDIILGLLIPNSGSIFIDNEFPVNCYQWHNKIGYVAQSIYLIDDTIEANIAFGDQSIDEKNLEFAINSAQLNKFINQLPNGSKTLVGERGMRLSGGERQRIAIARALYRKPEVLIFDEATSALDNETEKILMQTIQKISKNYTLIMIAHRLTTLNHCDRIIVLENGIIKEITQYKNLIPNLVIDNKLDKLL